MRPEGAMTSRRTALPVLLPQLADVPSVLRIFMEPAVGEKVVERVVAGRLAEDG